MREAARSGHLQPCGCRRCQPRGLGATRREACALSSVLNRGREMGRRRFAPRSLETVTAFGAEAPRGPGERSRRAGAALAYLQPERLTWLFPQPKVSPWGCTLPKPLLGARRPPGCWRRGGIARGWGRPGGGPGSVRRRFSPGCRRVASAGITPVETGGNSLPLGGSLSWAGKEPAQVSESRAPGLGARDLCPLPGAGAGAGGWRPASRLPPGRRLLCAVPAFLWLKEVL